MAESSQLMKTEEAVCSVWHQQRKKEKEKEKLQQQRVFALVDFEQLEHSSSQASVLPYSHSFCSFGFASSPLLPHSTTAMRTHQWKRTTLEMKRDLHEQVTLRQTLEQVQRKKEVEEEHSDWMAKRIEKQRDAAAQSFSAPTPPNSTPRVSQDREWKCVVRWEEAECSSTWRGTNEWGDCC